MCLDVLKWERITYILPGDEVFFFFPTCAHSFFSTPLAVGEWSMTDIHSHETNPKQLTQWSAPIRRELTVPYHGGATWGDFSAGTSLMTHSAVLH